MKITNAFFLLIILNSCSTFSITSIESNYLLNEQKKSKYYLIELIRTAQKENKLGEAPMLIIDGAPIYYYYKENINAIQIKKSDIKKIEIVQNSDCVKLYGDACKFGLMRIKTY